MKKLTLLFLGLGISLGIQASKEPEYASAKTKEVIKKMIEAHGGYQKWADLQTMSFSTTMHSESLGLLRFWVSDQTFGMKTKRNYQDWPLVGSQLSYDGEEVWTVDWRVGNPPGHQHSVFFYYVNLPWLTQDENVILGETDLIEHEAFDNKVYKVKMSFKERPIIGKSQMDTYTLYIDSENYLLTGYEYTIAYGPLLDIMNVPKDQPFFGPVLRKNNYIGEIDGLKFALLFTTHDADYTQQYGDHAVYNIQLNGEFDESRMVKPANAVVDPSIDVRK